MKQGLVVFFAALCAVLSGCFGGSSPQTQVYDLQSPAPESGLRLRAGVFRNFTPVVLNLQYQLPDGSVTVDPYRQWVLSPENMLRSYLLGAFGGNADPLLPFFSVDCTVFEFRTDMESGSCRMGVEYLLRRNGWSPYAGSFVGVEKFETKSAGAMSLAFSRLAARFAADLKKNALDEVEKKRLAEEAGQSAKNAVQKPAAAPETPTAPGKSSTSPHDPRNNRKYTL